MPHLLPVEAKGGGAPRRGRRSTAAAAAAAAAADAAVAARGDPWTEDDEAAAEEAAAAEAEAAEAVQDTVEMLLDVYDARLNSLGDQVEQLASTIENMQDGRADARQRAQPDRPPRALSMAGLCVGTCSAVSAGMNLLGLESAAALCLRDGASGPPDGLAFITCWRQFRSISNRQRDRLMDVDALKNVLGKLDLAHQAQDAPPPAGGRRCRGGGAESPRPRSRWMCASLVPVALVQQQQQKHGRTRRTPRST